MCKWWVSPYAIIPAILILVAYFVDTIGSDKSDSNGPNINQVKMVYGKDHMHIKLSNNVTGHSNSTTVSYAQAYSDCLDYAAKANINSTNCVELNNDKKKGNTYKGALAALLCLVLVLLVWWFLVDCGYCKTTTSIKRTLCFTGIIQLVAMILGIVIGVTGAEIKARSAITILGPAYFNTAIYDSGFSYSLEAALILIIIGIVVTFFSCVAIYCDRTHPH